MIRPVIVRTKRASSTQCAAVNTQSGAIKDPPHWLNPVGVLMSSEVIHGISPEATGAPPTTGLLAISSSNSRKVLSSATASSFRTDCCGAT